MTIVNPLCGLTYIVAAGQVREVAEFRKGVRKEEETSSEEYRSYEDLPTTMAKGSLDEKFRGPGDDHHYLPIVPI